MLPGTGGGGILETYFVVGSAGSFAIGGPRSLIVIQVLHSREPRPRPRLPKRRRYLRKALRDVY